MVGHTGNIDAAIEACEASDKGLGKIVDAFTEKAARSSSSRTTATPKKMLTEDGSPHTAHTTNPVPCVLIGSEQGVTLRSGGVLGDVAPTILALMGLDKPEEMTGESLIQS